MFRWIGGQKNMKNCKRKLLTPPRVMTRIGLVFHAFLSEYDISFPQRQPNKNIVLAQPSVKNCTSQFETLSLFSAAIVYYYAKRCKAIVDQDNILSFY